MVLALTVSLTTSVCALEKDNVGTQLVRFTFEDEAGRTREVDGRVLVRTDDGVLVEARSGRLWSITFEQLKVEQKQSESFQPLNADELAEVLHKELTRAGVKSPIAVHRTEHYVICSTAGLPCAKWSGLLLERLYKAFHVFWKGRGFKLSRPEFPLPVIITANQQEFARIAEFDRTPASAGGQGYYLITANRITLYDLTDKPGQRPAVDVADVSRRAQQIPASIAAVVHEATHQIAFNTGLHTRYADNPVWLTEGLAMYFETPDLKSSRGWRTIGRVNPARLRAYREFATTRRQPDSLKTLIQNNERFADRETARDAYAEAWALTCFLIRTRGRNYREYLETIAARPRLKFDEPEERVRHFETVFGRDLPTTDRQLQTFIRRLR